MDTSVRQLQEEQWQWSVLTGTKQILLADVHPQVLGGMVEYFARDARDVLKTFADLFESDMMLRQVKKKSITWGSSGVGMQSRACTVVATHRLHESHRLCVVPDAFGDILWVEVSAQQMQTGWSATVALATKEKIDRYLKEDKLSANICLSSLVSMVSEAANAARARASRLTETRHRLARILERITTKELGDDIPF